MTQSNVQNADVPQDDPLGIAAESEDEGHVRNDFEESFSNMETRLNAVVSINQEFLEKIQELTAEKDTLMEENRLLTMEVESLRGESLASNKELHQLKRAVQMMNSGTSKLDEILMKGKTSSDKSRVGFDTLPKKLACGEAIPSMARSYQFSIFPQDG